MTERLTTTDTPKMAHGHTRLIWLLDDIEAHLEGVRDSEEPALILEELVAYARAFNEELDGHIADEETNIFPRAEAVATAEELRELDEINAEHRQLEAQMKSFWAVLSQACETKGGDRHDLCWEDLFDVVGSIREHLAAHSTHERRFLLQVEPRVESSSFEV